MYYTKNENNQHINSVGTIFSLKLSKYDISFIPISERIMFTELNSALVKLNLMQVYTPIIIKPDEECETIYAALFNAKIGKGCISK